MHPKRLERLQLIFDMSADPQAKVQTSKSITKFAEQLGEYHVDKEKKSKEYEEFVKMVVGGWLLLCNHLNKGEGSEIDFNQYLQYIEAMKQLGEETGNYAFFDAQVQMVWEYIKNASGNFDVEGLYKVIQGDKLQVPIETVQYIFNAMFAYEDKKTNTTVYPTEVPLEKLLEQNRKVYIYEGPHVMYQAA